MTRCMPNGSEMARGERDMTLAGAAATLDHMLLNHQQPDRLGIAADFNTKNREQYVTNIQ